MSKFLITCPAGFENEAIDELKKYGIIANRTFFKGVLIGKSDRKKEEIINEIKNSETNYICKIYPIMRIRKLINIEWAKNFFLKKSNKIKGKRFLVICNRRGMHEFKSIDVEKEIGLFISKKTNAKPDYKKPEVLLIIDILQDIMILSIVNKDEYITKKPKIMKKYQEKLLNKSELKMREILERYGFIFSKNKIVLDIGSAPGGWVKAMSKYVKKIVAVDPAELHKSIRNLDNIIHLKIKIEDFDLNFKFDIITNDINKFYDENLELMKRIIKRNLKKNGFCIITLKMRFPDEESSLKEYVKNFIKENKLKLVDLVRLNSNRITEYTLIFTYT